MINFNFEKYCYGCAACKYKCPKSAIKMEYNSEGFLVPKIDMEKCIGCGVCEKVCPYLNEDMQNKICEEDVICAAYRKNTKNYRNYTSSGIFSEIARNFIEAGNYVAGCIWDENMKARHIVSCKMNDIRKMACSKYVQSDIQEIYEEIHKVLNLNKKILICGTPCQIAAIKRSFISNNIYTIAIVCHGTPSPKVWEKYKEKLEKEQNSKMINANFRYKGKFGWITPYTKYEFENGKKIKRLSFTDDPYVIAFGEDLLHRNSCYECKYKGSNSGADLIIGDFWGCPSRLLKKSHNKGISAVIVHTENGKKLLEKISDKFNYEEECVKDIVKENNPILNPVKYNFKREDFYTDFIKNESIDKFSFSTDNFKYKLKKIMYKIYVFEIIKRIKYKFKH